MWCKQTKYCQECARTLYLVIKPKLMVANIDSTDDCHIKDVDGENIVNILIEY